MEVEYKTVEAIVREMNHMRGNDAIAAIVGAAMCALHEENALSALWCQEEALSSAFRGLIAW